MALAQLGKIKHLLVDLDGTLVGNRGTPMAIKFMQLSYSELRKRAPTLNRIRALKALLGINKQFKSALGGEPNDVRLVQYFSNATGLSTEHSRSVLKSGVNSIFPHLKPYFYPMPGAYDFLEWAKQHFSLTLATNPVWPTEIITLRATWGGIDTSIFKNITHIRSMSACKPKAHYFREILLQSGLRPEETLLIGNDFKMDLPATRIGIPVFIVHPSRKLEQIRSKGAHAWQGHFGDLKTILQGNHSAV